MSTRLSKTPQVKVQRALPSEQNYMKTKNYMKTNNLQ